MKNATSLPDNGITQDVLEVAPVYHVVYPEEHRWQFSDDMSDLYLPTGHREHTCALECHSVPIGQGRGAENNRRRKISRYQMSLLFSS